MHILACARIHLGERRIVGDNSGGVPFTPIIGRTTLQTIAAASGWISCERTMDIALYVPTVNSAAIAQVEEFGIALTDLCRDLLGISGSFMRNDA